MQINDLLGSDLVSTVPRTKSFEMFVVDEDYSADPNYSEFTSFNQPSDPMVGEPGQSDRIGHPY